MWCGIYISCTPASGGDEMKEKQYNREIKKAGGEREERGVLPSAGKWRREGECVKKKKAEEEGGEKAKERI